jgi:peptidoglycan/xylan/chitin deacetylase (PgdA/CDA1 family)
VLQRLGIRATFYLCPDGFGKAFPHLGEGLATLSEDEARALHDAGMELGSHTMTHRDVLWLSDADLRREFVESREAVESITGEPCRTIAYPSGRHDARVERAARRAGYEAAFACVPGPWDRFAAPRWQGPATADPEPVARRLGLPREEVLSRDG